MTLSRPTSAELASIAHDLAIPLEFGAAQQFAEIVGGTLDAFDSLDQPYVDEPVERGPVAHVRPTTTDDPYNAWFVRSDLTTSRSGPLAHQRIAIKDNIMVGGLPMSAGARLLDGFAPTTDATVVARVLAAGATITGKTNCEYLCLDGSSFTSDFGVVRNPHRPEFSAGGSSSGNAVALSTGEVDVAVGTDQAGSIRVPASFSGVVGLKPTHGLVPYTGALGIAPIIDHAGPMSRTVHDAAALLAVIAGYDEYDARQRDVQVSDYLAELDAGVRGLRIGVLNEGFDQPGSERVVDDTVRRAGEAIADLGATVTDVSIPDHRRGLAYWTPLVIHGMQATIMNGQGFGVGQDERFCIPLLEHLWNERGRLNELPPTVVSCALAAEYVRRDFGITFYARAVNAIRDLRRQYDRALDRVDALLMPTTPHRAHLLPGPGTTIVESVTRANGMFSNTAVFNGTGHPAISIPCGTAEGLPIGLQLVGKRYAEATLLRIAHAFERRDFAD